MTVDPSVLVHIDPHDKAFEINPFAVWSDLRNRAPVAWSDRHGGFWVVTRYEDIFTILHDPLTFGSAEGVTFPRNPEMPNIVLLESDPPMHGQYRSLLNGTLTPRRSEALEPYVQAVVTDLVDGFIEKGEADLVGDLARPLAQMLLFHLLGVPDEEAPRIRELLYTGSRRFIEDPAAAKLAMAEFFGFLGSLVARRLAEPPRDDLLGHLLGGEVDGRPVTPEEVARLLIVVFVGGMNTVKSQLGGSFLYLAEHPEQRSRLIENPDLVPNATEELLRYVSPIHGLFRTVMQDTELGGQQFRKGERVFFVFASANRDEKVFSDPQRCDFDRRPNRHMAFGLGVHRCIGSHLARIEVRLALSEVLRRLPDYRITPGAAIRWDLGPGVRGVDYLPVSFTPGRRLVTK